VIAAVVAFGALLSVGNERQRRAIDALHRLQAMGSTGFTIETGNREYRYRSRFTAWLTRSRLALVINECDGLSNTRSSPTMIP
jgi:hypothetical protein